MLNADLMHELRLRADVGKRQVAQALGVTEATITGLEKRGDRSAGQLPLRMLFRLAELLGTTPDRLLIAKCPDPSLDRATIASILSSSVEPISVRRLMDLTGWEESRVDVALQELRASLAGSGQALKASLAGYSIGADQTFLPSGLRIRQSHYGRPTDLSMREFRVLRAVATLPPNCGDWEARLARRTDARYGLTRLIRAGFITIENKRPVLTEVVRRSLGLPPERSADRAVA